MSPLLRVLPLFVVLFPFVKALKWSPFPFLFYGCCYSTTTFFSLPLSLCFCFVCVCVCVSQIILCECSRLSFAPCALKSLSLNAMSHPTLYSSSLFLPCFLAPHVFCFNEEEETQELIRRRALGGRIIEYAFAPCSPALPLELLRVAAARGEKAAVCNTCCACCSPCHSPFLCLLHHLWAFVCVLVVAQVLSFEYLAPLANVLGCDCVEAREPMCTVEQDSLALQRLASALAEVELKYKFAVASVPDRKRWIRVVFSRPTYQSPESPVSVTLDLLTISVSEEEAVYEGHVMGEKWPIKVRVCNGTLEEFPLAYVDTIWLQKARVRQSPLWM